MIRLSSRVISRDAVLKVAEPVEKLRRWASRNMTDEERMKAANWWSIGPDTPNVIVTTTIEVNVPLEE